ncbi:hypothetical protein E2P81_ATG02927 [Venturia nashicola]|uniref:BTB domain-containing protein n=1 Tax=Venturia nashicola TaxID=86259 RepID=A0A4Z1PMA0_9PEZI|nr:hypothetical protein E6O75_ATG02990 [Venturia nashicola]TLD36038.1 hypothetical protein E2P81_ATG02927 [Venturia nashicola]
MTPSGMISAVQLCFESGKYSDLTVQSGACEFKVHKVVVCEQSEWFTKATKNNTFLESQTGIVNMNEDEPDAVAAMLEYLYKDDYTLSYPFSMTKDSPEAKGHEMMFHLHVYALADKLRIPALKETSSNYFGLLVSSYWSDPAFPSVVQFTYSIAPPGQDGDGLRRIVVSTAGIHAKEFLVDTNELFLSMMEGLADFGKDLSQWLAKKGTPNPGGEEFTCTGCSLKFKATLRANLKDLTCPACTTNDSVSNRRNPSRLKLMTNKWGEMGLRRTSHWNDEGGREPPSGSEDGWH